MKEQKFQLGYAVMDADSTQELMVKCQSLLSQGFEPAGGVSVAGTVGLLGAGGVRFYQALFFKREILEESEAPPLHAV